VQRSVRAYASLPRYESPSDVARAAVAMAKDGFTAIKLHQIDVASVAAAREAVGDDVELMLDTNCPWTVDEATRMARRLERYALRWLEEPVWPPEDYAGLARVRAATTIPVASGENEATAFGFRAAFAAGGMDIAQPSITKVGGLSEMRKVAVVAASANVTVVPHAFYYGPGLAASVHFAVATPGVPYVEFPGAELEASLLAEPIRAVGGHLDADDRPGFGADPDPSVVERYTYRLGAGRAFDLT
jgi:D-galactarolactone cycloisomerase